VAGTTPRHVACARAVAPAIWRGWGGRSICRRDVGGRDGGGGGGGGADGTDSSDVERATGAPPGDHGGVPTRGSPGRVAADAGLPWRLPVSHAARDQRYAAPVDMVEPDGVGSKKEGVIPSDVGRRDAAGGRG